MRVLGKIVTACGLLFWLSSAVAQPLTTTLPTSLIRGAIQFNMVTDGGAVGNGIVDDAPAFIAAAFTLRANAAAAAGAPVTVVLPPGYTFNFASCTYQGNPYYDPLFYGIPNLTIIAYGAKIEQTASASCGYFGSHTFYEGDATKIAAFTTTAAGASCVTMVTSGQETRFPVGSYTMASGLQLEYSGYPPNFGFFEYQQVASVNTSTHEVCFTAPLQYSYESTWPTYDQEAVSGGPATLYLMQSDWNSHLMVEGGTWAPYGSNEFGFLGRFVTLNDLIWSNSALTVSQSQTVTINNINNPVRSGSPFGIDVDKDIGSLIINGSFIYNLNQQSTSVHSTILNNSIVTFLAGTTQKTICNNSTITNLTAGSAYGAPGPFIGNNCNIGALETISLNAYGQVVNSGWAIALGVFTNSIGSPYSWAVPNGKVLFSGALIYEGYFNVEDLSESDPNFSISTTIPGDLPALPENGSSQLLAVQDPLPFWACNQCYGSPDVADYSQAGAQNAPLYTYSQRIYTCTNNLLAAQAAYPTVPVIDINNPPAANQPGGGQSPVMWGNFDSLTVNVLVADTSGAETSNFYPISPYGMYVVDSSLDKTLWAEQTIDMLTTGVRVITPGGTTGSTGADSISAPGVVTLGLQTNPAGTDISSETAAECPVVEATWQANR